jgi:tight adherence protein B
VTGLLLALAAGYGAFLLWTALAYGWRGLRPGPAMRRRRDPRRLRARQWLAQAGLDGVAPREFGAVAAALGVAGAAVGFTLFGTPVAALGGVLLGAAVPVASARARRQRARLRAAEAWPRLIEEVRVLTGSLGRSVPQALLEAGARAPEELRAAFAAARREWLLSTDFERTVGVLKARLADPAADATCETLLVAHEVGGTDLDRRLGALVEDRVLDVQGRKDGVARQAGARFARRFVLLVPLGMGLAGLSIGEGRAAYQTALGQAGVAVALAMVAACWVWAGRVMRLPEEPRVFAEGEP